MIRPLHSSDKARKDRSGRLYRAFDPGWTKWPLDFMTGFGHKVYKRTINARALIAMADEIAKARKHFKILKNILVLSCYEADRDWF